MSDSHEAYYQRLYTKLRNKLRNDPMTNQPAPSDTPITNEAAFSINPNGSVTYDPAGGYVGRDTCEKLELAVARLSAEREKEREELSQAVLTASDAANLYKTVLGNLMPFVLEDYHQNCATSEFKLAVEAAKELFPK